MSEKTVRVSRYRNGDYVVNYDVGGRLVTYKWAGCRGNRIDTKEIPAYVVDWLIMNTNAINNGSLVIEKDEDSKEIRENINYEEVTKYSTHTRQEIETLLKGNYNRMKSQLNQITNKSEKEFIINVAQDLKLDSVAKREFLSDWIGIKSDMLFVDVE